MAFSDQLKSYVEAIDATPKDIATTARLSPSTFSRYISGKRTPAADSGAIEQLATALASLSNGTLNATEVAAKLRLELTGSETDATTFTQQFSTLVDALEINGNH